MYSQIQDWEFAFEGRIKFGIRLGVVPYEIQTIVGNVDASMGDIFLLSV